MHSQKLNTIQRMYTLLLCSFFYVFRTTLIRMFILIALLMILNIILLKYKASLKHFFFKLILIMLLSFLLVDLVCRVKYLFCFQ